MDTLNNISIRTQPTFFSLSSPLSFWSLEHVCLKIMWLRSIHNQVGHGGLWTPQYCKNKLQTLQYLKKIWPNTNIVKLEGTVFPYTEILIILRRWYWHQWPQFSMNRKNCSKRVKIILDESSFLHRCSLGLPHGRGKIVWRRGRDTDGLHFPWTIERKDDTLWK